MLFGLPLVLASGLGWAADGGTAGGLPAGNTEVPITGGSTAPVGTWPDAAAILGTQGYCSGTLIAPDVVLTAGHCAETMPSTVRLNTTDYNGTSGVTARVRSVTAYPNWQSTYDIAVVVLDAPVQGVTPRTVATSCTYTAGWTNGANVELVGFGATDVQAQANNSRLYQVAVPLTDAMCADGNGCKTGVSPGGEFVAGGDGRDSCNGDSGGPVYMDTPRGTLLVGAVSRATSTATNPCGDGGIYVRTDKVIAWIEQTTGRTLDKDTCEGSGDVGDGSSATGSDDGATYAGNRDSLAGGCSAGGSSTALASLAVSLAFVVRGRRRRAAA